MYPPMVDFTYGLERQKTLRGEPIRELPVLRYGHRADIWQVFQTAATWLRTRLENWGQVPCALMEPACDMQLTR
jgi:hypothetical protein